MPTLKQKLEQAGIELAQAKFMYQEAQREFDMLYRMVVNSGKAKAAGKPPVEDSDSEVDSEARVSQGANGHGEKVTYAAKIEEFLVEHQEEATHYREIARVVGCTPNTCRTLLNSLAKVGKAKRVGRGKWMYPIVPSKPLGRSSIEKELLG
jgi:hypothetical protein